MEKQTMCLSGFPFYWRVKSFFSFREGEAVITYRAPLVLQHPFG